MRVKRIDLGLSMELGAELFLLGFYSGTAKAVYDGKLLEGKSKVHIMLQESKLEEMDELARFIQDMALHHFQKQSQRILIYSPNDEICKELSLRQVSSEWYNFYVNLWDELTIDGQEEPMEYMFYTNPEMGRVSYAIELQMPREFSPRELSPRELSLCYCNTAVDTIIDRVGIDTPVYYVIKTREEYEMLRHVAAKSGKARDCFYLILQEHIVSVEEMERDGFKEATQEK